jgi:cation diffusion facilitator CzcD-associated flavoprotein CzcO
MGAAPQHEALIVGAGFGGMGAAIQLQRLGIQDFVIVDRADDLGGTWYLNHYPGLAVDIASVTYSYSFEPNPFWQRRFARGPELRAYCNHVADKYRLRERMRFNSEVEQVVYDEENQLWTVNITGQAPITARVLILATGYLSRPQRPDIPGIDSFAGKVIHTAAWDESYDLKGKRVGSIGTGATAVQLLPTIAPDVERLDVYQRTPIWCVAKIDYPVPKWLQRLFATMPLLMLLLRLLNNARIEFMTTFALFQHARLPWMIKLAEGAGVANIARAVKDPELRRKLIPRYPFGCKRPTFSNAYYPMFNRKNVELVTDGIDHIEPNAIVTKDGTRREIDTLVLATGFGIWEKDTFHSIVGKGGVELRDHWQRTRYESYQGLTIPGFPNLFYLPAPYSYTGLSYFFTLEGQMIHIDRVLRTMRTEGAKSFEVKQAAADDYVARMTQFFQPSVFSMDNCHAAKSYYFDSHGKPSVIRPSSVIRAHKEQASFPLSDYQFA